MFWSVDEEIIIIIMKMMAFLFQPSLVIAHQAGKERPVNKTSTNAENINPAVTTCAASTH